MVDLLRVGVITSAHGIRGEVNVFPTSDDPERFEKLESVIVKKGAQETIRRIENVKYFKKMVILKLEGIDDRNAAELLKSNDLMVDREHAQKLEEGEYFIADLIGLKVVTDDGQELGILKDVMETGANDVYIVKTAGGKEILLPVIPDCVLRVDLETGLVEVHLMPGLLDL